MRRLYPLLLISSIFLLISCGEDEGFTEPVIVPVGFASVVNFIPDSPELSVVGSGQLIGRVSYLEASGLVRVTPQVPVGYSVLYLLDRREAVLLESTVTVQINDVVTVLLTGSMAAPVPVLVDSSPLDSDPDNTDTRIVFLNTSSIDTARLTLTNPNADTQTFPIPSATVVESTTASGSGVRIEIKDDSTGEALWSSGDFEAIPNAEFLFVLANYFGPGDNKVRMVSVGNAMAFPNEELDGAVRIANIVADRGPLDVFVDGNLTATNLAFGSIAEYQPISAGEHEFSVSVFGEPTNIIATTMTTVNSGDYITVAIAGMGDDNSFSTILDDRRPVDSRARLQITKLAPSIGAVDIYLIDTGMSISETLPITTNLQDFVTFAIELEAASFDIVITNSGSIDALIDPVTLNLDNNNLYSIMLTDSEGGGEPLQMIQYDSFN